MNKAEWILGGMLAALLIVVAGLAIMLWQQPDQLTAPPAPIEGTSDYIEQTALSAFAVAQREASQWQSDAQLIKATSTWRQSKDEQTINDGKAAWSFTFYTPTGNSASVISVSGFEASLISSRLLDTGLIPANETGWKVDSGDAVKIMLDEGGREFLRDEGMATMLMNLTTLNENGRIEWFVSLINEQTGNSFSIRIDANNSQILDVSDAS